MKQRPKVSLCIIIALLAAMVSGAHAYRYPVQEMQPDNADRTLSPYFLVDCDGPGKEQLPLKSTKADVTISGVIADVTVTQTYENEGKIPIEAIYVFPASTRAAVYDMKMTIGDRTIEAQIKKRDEARRDYETAKQQGKSASLLEQQRPNVFQMNVANIMPGDIVKVELKYTELLVPTDKIYEFVYPTVVGPRYSNLPPGSSTDPWVENPYLPEGELPTYDFALDVNLHAGMPIQKVASTSHKLNVQFTDRENAVIRLDSSEKQGGNRDFILRYGLAGEAVDSGLLLYRGEKDNFFLLMMQPPERVTENDIPGREYIFIVDVSGSMHGFPLDTSKELMRNLIGDLRPTDRFNVVLFAGTSSILSERSVPATQGNIMRAIHHIDSQRGGGGTEILPALQRALALPENENYSRTVVIATDGYVRVEEEVFDLIRNNLGSANMFTFGIGSSVNRHLIEGMAHAGMGEPFVVTHPEKAASEAKKLRKMIESPVLTNVKINYGKFKAYDTEPLAVPDVLAERPVIVFGKWRGAPEGRITISGISGDRKWEDSIDIEGAQLSYHNGALQYLWARERVKILSDYNRLSLRDERVQEVTALGLTYNLLTQYTSFVAVDSAVRNRGGASSTVTQPLPLPEGVTDNAVGGMGAVRSLAQSPGRYRNMAKAYAAPHEVEKLSEQKDETRTGRLSIENLTVSDGVSKSHVLQVIQAHLKELKKCLGAWQGTIHVKLSIDSQGRVVESMMNRAIEVEPQYISCKSLIKQWKYPSPGKGNSHAITFDLVLR